MYEDYLLKIKQFFKECWRVLKVTKKPTPEEFKAIVKVASLGILAIGLIGFVILVFGTMNF